jgi:hypothetical protein
MRESPPPPPLIADVIAGDGISWSRLVTAVVLLALSVAIGYRTARDPPQPEAVPQPVRERVVAGIDLPPLRPIAAGVPAPVSGSSAPEAGGSLEAPRHAGHVRVAERDHVAPAAHHSSASRALRPRRHHVAHARGELRATERKVRTRAQVRAEYLRHREVVAALTGEDSGSAYLTRVAARQRAARLEGAGRRRG